MKTKKIPLLIILLMCVNLMITISAQEIRNIINSLPEKAKLKTVRYSEKYSEYTVNGYVHEKQFVEGQYITIIIKTYNRIDTISGTYYIKNNIPLLESTVRNKKITIYGSFDQFTEIDKGSLAKALFKITNSKDGNAFTAIPSNSKKLSIEVKDIYHYQGLIKNYPIIFQKQSEEQYSLKIQYKDLILETVIPDAVVRQNINYDFDNYIKESQEVKLSYNSGDVFIGTVKKRSSFYNKTDADYEPSDGRYAYATGEAYTGIYGNTYLNGRIFVPYQGETIFADGAVANGDWLKQYEFTYNEWRQIYENCNTLTEIRDMAIQLNEEKQQKLQAEKIAKEQVKQERQKTEKERKQKYISKYGEYYGSLISNGELASGMSQAMVNEVYNKTFFNRRTAVRNSQTIEVWKFDKEKMQVEILKEGAKNKDNGGGEAALAAIFMMNFSEQMGGTTVPKMLIFKNNKLTEIYR